MLEYCIHGVASIILRNINEKEHILIQKRQKGANSFETGLIEIPCGKVKSQESVFECIRNKVLIETGLKITKIYGENDCEIVNLNQYEILNYTPFLSSQNIKGNYPIIIEAFICEADGEPVTESKDAKDIRWISLDSLQHLLKENEKLFYPMILNPLKRYIHMKLK